MDAAKLLETSASEATYAYDDWEDALEMTEAVRTRSWRGRSTERGSSCQTELVGSTGPYNLPLRMGRMYQQMRCRERWDGRTFTTGS
jgi:hypothetical protein